MNFARKIGPPIVPLLILTIVSEALVRQGFIAPYLLPAPTDIFTTMLSDWYELSLAFFSTGYAAFAGLSLSFVIGALLAFLFSTSDWLKRAFYPYATFFQTVPIIAIAPLLVIWFGFGHPTIIASSFIVSVFPIIAGTLLGLESTEPELLDLFRLYRATPSSTILKLKIPSALPFIFSGLRVASGLAVIGAIVGEFIAGTGLGSVIDASRTQQRLDKVFAALLLATILGLCFITLINVLSKIFLSDWHASERVRP
jgi:NitT/TauT family transport system permease protein